MGLLEDLTGGGAQQQSYRDYISRYQQGHPNDGITDQEAASRYDQVAGEVDPATYRDSAREALTRMSPQERADYAQQLGAAAGEQGVDHGWDGAATDPDALARMTTNVHQQSPGLLGGLLGGAGGGLGGMLGGLLGGGGGGGGGGLGGLLGGGGSPVVKAVLGGIAAMAAGRMMRGGSGLGNLP